MDQNGFVIHRLFEGEPLRTLAERSPENVALSRCGRGMLAVVSLRRAHAALNGGGRKRNPALADERLKAWGENSPSKRFLNAWLESTGDAVIPRPQTRVIERGAARRFSAGGKKRFYEIRYESEQPAKVGGNSTAGGCFRSWRVSLGTVEATLTIPVRALRRLWVAGSLALTSDLHGPKRISRPHPPRGSILPLCAPPRSMTNFWRRNWLYEGAITETYLPAAFQVFHGDGG